MFKRWPLVGLIFLGASLGSAALAQGWQYLAQTPPGEAATRFPPEAYQANAQWFWHGSPVFSPDGREMYWVRYYIANDRTQIWFTHFEGGRWATPERASFSSAQYFDNNPQFTDANTLYFLSQRLGVSRIYRVTRDDGAGWSPPSPVNLPIPLGNTLGLQFSFAQSGNLYAELDVEGGGDIDLYRWRPLPGGGYAQPERIEAVASSYLEFTPFVDPAERYLVFSSNRPWGVSPMDLYISYPQAGGTWGAPQNLGSPINETFGAFPSVSPDGLYLFFNTLRPEDAGYNPYWIATERYVDLRPGDEGLGDLDHSGVVDAADLHLQELTLVGRISPGGATFFARREKADLNGDGLIDGADLAALRSHLAE